MENPPLALRVAQRFRLLVALIGLLSATAVLVDLATTWLADGLVLLAVSVIGVAAAITFSCMIFDMRFQRAVSAFNAASRASARTQKGLGRFIGLGLAGDRLLLAVGLLLLITTLAAANLYHRAPATALGFVAFALVCLTQIALMARGYPTDRFVPPFT